MNEQLAALKVRLREFARDLPEVKMVLYDLITIIGLQDEKIEELESELEQLRAEVLG